ncbi:lysine-specific histone demethylase 2-like [Bolinopsis microptera]|uniref:lysine-specific histone demethylase 2-like n=1 Tax=Bolinopsis microptera TaxID=2820187 RepID=UPI003078F272
MQDLKPNKRKRHLIDKGGADKLDSCGRGNCKSPGVECFSSVACSVSTKSARWYHVSDTEHFCNSCFEYFYRPQKKGYTNYFNWKLRWQVNSQCEPGVKLYFTEEVLPYWIRCSECRKWRKLDQDKKLVETPQDTWTCSENKGGSCSSEEEPQVKLVSGSGWLERLGVPPLIKNSPAEPFLVHYYSDGVGMSASMYQQPKRNGHDSEELLAEPVVLDGPLDSNFKPFNQPGQQGKALCFRPDIMEMDEERTFPEFKRFQVFYLALRNLILALWNINPKEHLTVADVEKAVIVRGMVRIRYSLEALRVLSFLTQRGIINTGILPLNINPDLLIITPKRKPEILVVGAGISGLAAARQLTMFGYKVKIFEGRDRVGGRIWDDQSLGTCVAKGAQIITGCINNPATLMCKQLDIPLHVIRDNGCELFEENGCPAAPDHDRRTDFHFNALLDAVAEWKLERLNLAKAKNVENRDSEKGENCNRMSLEDKLMELHKLSMSQNRQVFSEDEKRLLQFHLSNLEYACGAPIAKVSAMWWDQNEEYSQFTGDHAFLYKGYSLLADALAEGLDIQLSEEVTRIDYTGDKVLVKTPKDEYLADKVIVTLPLAVLKKEVVSFKPPLPDWKQHCINRIGAGCIEKIAMKFTKKFWQSKIKGADFFGHVPSSEEHRGLFAIFYDMNTEVKEGPYVLMSIVTGEALEFRNNTSDLNVLKSCLQLLRNMFDDVPDPEDFWVTSWGRDRFSLMSYSYMAIGSSGKDYDHLAADVEEKVFFAGEATNRRFPQTVTGAYLSGIREACKIVERGYSLPEYEEMKDDKK